jgi:hypothetical protein
MRQGPRGLGPRPTLHDRNIHDGGRAVASAACSSRRGARSSGPWQGLTIARLGTLRRARCLDRSLAQPRRDPKVSLQTYPKLRGKLKAADVKAVVPWLAELAVAPAHAFFHRAPPHDMRGAARLCDRAGGRAALDGRLGGPRNRPRPGSSPPTTARMCGNSADGEPRRAWPRSAAPWRTLTCLSGPRPPERAHARAHALAHAPLREHRACA